MTDSHDFADLTSDSADLPQPESKKPRKPRTTKYEVVKAAIAPNGGSRDDLIRPGEVVELTAEQAKFYNEKGFLKPYIGD